MSESMGVLYGLKEIPFEPTGAATRKYPYVLPENFSHLEEQLKASCLENKLYVILLNSPQGGGKSSTIEEIKKRVEQGDYSFKPSIALSNKLLDLDIQHYISDVLDVMKKFGYSSTAQLSDMTPRQLKQELVKCILETASKTFLFVWIIDEFDILVDKPEDEQRVFLQFLRNVIDDLAEKRLSIVFLMSHTLQSSIEFQKHLRQMHGPFRDRIVASIDLGYRFEKVKEIVEARLESVRIEDSPFSGLEPFTEDSLRVLYDLVVSLGGSAILNNFRVFERCCYYAIWEGGQSRRRALDSGFLREVFERHGVEQDRVLEKRNISITTRSTIATKRRAEPIELNEAILRGLIKGFELLGENFELADFSTDYLGPTQKSAIHVSCTELIITHRLGIKDQQNISFLWFLVTNKTDIISSQDVEYINEATFQSLRARNKFINIVGLSYVSSIDVDHSLFRNCDVVIPISPMARDDLIGLSTGVENDIRELRGTFDSEIAPILRKQLVRQTADITHKVADPVVRLTKTLNVKHFAGEVCTSLSLREFEKSLFMRGRTTSEKFIREMVRLGFAVQKGTRLIPKVPKAMEHLIKLLGGGDQSWFELHEVFSESLPLILSPSKDLRLVKSTDTQIVKNRVSTLEQEIDENLDLVRSIISQKDLARIPIGRTASTLLKACDNVKNQGNEFNKIVVYTTFIEVLDTITLKLKDAVKLRAPPPDTAAVKRERAQREGAEEEIKGEEEEQQKSAWGSLQIHEDKKRPLPEAIEQILREKGPLTINALQKEVKNRGLQFNRLRQTVISLVLTNVIQLAVG